MKNKPTLRLIALTAFAGAILLRAETISIDFNTFALTGEKAEMHGADPSFQLGDVWNQVTIPRENDGTLDVSDLKDSEGNATGVSFHIEASQMKSWWHTVRKPQPVSRVYRDYLGLPDGAKIQIKGLQPDTTYQIGALGYPLSWGKVDLSLNGQSVLVESGLTWTDDDRTAQRPAGVFSVMTDAEGTLSGVVNKGTMWSGLHLSTQPLSLSEQALEYVEPLPQVEPAPKFPPSKQVVYKTVGGFDLVMDIYQPADFSPSDQRPAVLFFHGGSWSEGWKTYFSEQCHYLATRGMVAITVEYRLTNRHKTTPAECLMDAKSAMRYVRKHAESMGIDPNKIAAGGNSAGGHLAAATAYSDAYNEPGEDLSVSCRPNLLVLLSPVIDNAPDGSYPYGPQPMTENWHSWSPMQNITPEKVLPTIFFLGEKDQIIPASEAEEFKARTKTAGAEAQLYIYAGGNHNIFLGGKGLTSSLYLTDRFFTKHGYLEGAPTIEDPFDMPIDGDHED